MCENFKKLLEELFTQKTNKNDNNNWKKRNSNNV